MKSIKPHIAALTFVVSLFSFNAHADGPRGFKADWYRSETAVTDALSAAYESNFDEMRRESKIANDALLDLATYAAELPQEKRPSYTQALDQVRIAAQQLQQSDVVASKDTAIAAVQRTLQKLTAARTSIPDDWFHSDTCTGIRKQRHRC
jgi:hypothetical protein